MGCFPNRHKSARLDRYLGTGRMSRLALGIRREVKNQWERRVPLTPSHIEKLVKDYNATVYIQPSTKRIYPDAAYSAVREATSG